MHTYANSAIVLESDLLRGKLKKLWDEWVHAEEEVRTIAGLEFDVDDFETTLPERDEDDQKLIQAAIDAQKAFADAWYEKYPELTLTFSYHNKEDNERADEVNGCFCIVEAEQPKPSAVELFAKGILERKNWTTFG